MLKLLTTDKMRFYRNIIRGRKEKESKVILYTIWYILIECTGTLTIEGNEIE